MEEEKKDFTNIEETPELSTENVNVENDLQQGEIASEESKQESEVKKGSKVGKAFATFGKTIWRWTKRTFMGASKDLAKGDVFAVEAIESPGKQTVKAFFRKPLAVIALSVLVFMFLLVFIGSAALPLDLSYNESMHVNLAPSSSMMSVPKALAKDVKSISTYSYFSVGVSNAGKLYVWGNTKIPNSIEKTDMKKLPDELKDAKVAFAAAGYNHAIAITEDGRVIGWGEYDNAQYGDKGSLYGTAQVINMPSQFINGGTIDVSQVKELVCGYQVTAIVMKNGRVYCWGNYKSGADNMKPVNAMVDVEKLVFAGTRCAVLKKDGTLWLGSAAEAMGAFEHYDENGNMEIMNLITSDYLTGRRVVDIACTNTSFALITEDGELLITGEYNESRKNYIPRPKLADGEKIVEIYGGSKHFTIRTNKGNVYSFGQNELKQSKGSATIDENGRIFVGAFQNYVVNGNNKLTKKWGFRGYFMGSDELGRDVFARIINGGRMTMTIGAVAVIISAIIGVVIGVISGYFGGWVDLLLMRVTEVFSAIPFLPFALILSAVLAGSSLSENTRIFMIMVVLGLLSWTGLARMVRGQVLAEREKEFVVAAKAMGIKESRIAFKHILPNVISIILVSLTLDFAGCMLTESGLSYLGFGVQLPRPTWGNMLYGGNNEIVIGSYWWRWLFPSMALLLSTISINIIGDTLRDVFDPKSSAER